MKYSHKKHKQTSSKHLWVLVGAVVVVLVATVVLARTTSLIPGFHKRNIPKTATITTKVQPHKSTKPSEKANTTETPPNTTAKEGDEPQNTSGNGAKPDTPSGTFISNHHPNLDNNPHPSAIQSVCTTTPGAKCYMKFTMGNLTRTLPEQTTNGEGNAFWSWDVNQSGFTEGTWTVTVYATINGQTSTAQDTIEVGA